MSFICPKSKPTAADIIILAFCILAVISAVLIPYFSKEATLIEIVCNGTTEVVSLNKDRILEISSDEYLYVVEIAHGEAYVREANCPDLTCTKAFPIGKRQGSIICVPGNLIIRTVNQGGADDEADIIIP